MKPYGMPRKYHTWSISKTRERQHQEEVKDFNTSVEISQYDELEYTIQVHLEEDGIFRSLSNVFEETALAIDPDEALEKLAHILYKKENI